MSDELLSNGTVEFRQEERNHAIGRHLESTAHRLKKGESYFVALDLQAELEDMCEMAKIVTDAVRDEDRIAFHYGIQGLEFELLRAIALLGDEVQAQRLHRLVGDHSPEKCPVCSGEAAFARKTADSKARPGS